MTGSVRGGADDRAGRSRPIVFYSASTGVLEFILESDLKRQLRLPVPSFEDLEDFEEPPDVRSCPGLLMTHWFPADLVEGFGRWSGSTPINPRQLYFDVTDEDALVAVLIERGYEVRRGDTELESMWL